MYVNYGLIISIIASILGIVLGNLLIGNYFLEMEMVYYEIPYYNIVTIPLVYEVAVGIVAIITLVTYLSCRKILGGACEIQQANLKSAGSLGRQVWLQELSQGDSENCQRRIWQIHLYQPLQRSHHRIPDLPGYPQIQYNYCHVTAG